MNIAQLIANALSTNAGGYILIEWKMNLFAAFLISSRPLYEYSPVCFLTIACAGVTPRGFTNNERRDEILLKAKDVKENNCLHAINLV